MVGQQIAFTLDEAGNTTLAGMATTNASGIATLAGASLHSLTPAITPARWRPALPVTRPTPVAAAAAT